MAHIALFLHGLSAGGVQRSTMNLAAELIRRGHRIDIVCCTDKGAGRAMVPAGAYLHALRRHTRLGYAPLAWRAQPAARRLMIKPVILPLFPQKAMYYLPALTSYLVQRRPDALISADTYCNIGAIWARGLAGVATRIVVSERNTLSVQLQRPERRHAWRWRYAPQLVGATYPLADGIVSVSDGVGDDLAALCGLPRDRITTIYNPVHFGPELEQRADQVPDHAWLQPGQQPLILAAGRLVKPKDFATLVRAFALLRRTRPARLLILGEEQERGERARLLSLARELGVGSDVDLPGHVANPYAYYRRAAVFALSSYREGLGNVLIEALACGSPVVSTDCPHGPAEILGGGKYGRLVPVADAEALAAAIAATLDDPLPRDVLRARGASFTAARAASAYLDLCGLGRREIDEAPVMAGAEIQNVA
jgi:glycosyltransferase involved in cell wall biosynthesis